MARIRSIHPGICTDEAFMSMTMACRAAWPMLWCQCDDRGVFEWKPLVLKARIFPADNLDFADILTELEGLDCVRRFESEGKSYGLVRNFAKYQRPKKPSYQHPVPEWYGTYVGLTAAVSPPAPHQFPTSGEIPLLMEDGGDKMEEEEEDGEEEEPKTVLPKQKRGTRVPEDFKPDQTCSAVADELGVSTQDRRDALNNFLDYWRGVPGSKGRKLDWQATFRNSLRAYVKRKGGNHVRSKPSRADEALAAENTVRARMGLDPKRIGHDEPVDADWGIG